MICLSGIAFASTFNQTTIWSTYDTDYQDYSGNNYDGTNSGTLTSIDTTHYKFGDGSANFTTGYDYISYGTVVAGDATGSILGWVKPDPTAIANYIPFFGAFSTTANFCFFEMYGVGYLQGGCHQSSSPQWNLRTTYPVINTSDWVQIVLIQDGTPELYVNNVSVAQGFTVSTDVTRWFDDMAGDVFYVGRTYPSNFDYKGLIDSAVYVSGRAVTTLEISEHFRAGPNATLPPVLPTSSLSVVFKNTTGATKTLFNEGENYFVYANWSLDTDGTPLTNNNGTCSVTSFNGLSENESDVHDFTLCSAGCTYTSLKDEFNMHSTYTSVMDLVEIEVCHNQRPTGNIDLKIDCATGTSTVNLGSGQIPICSTYTPKVQVNFSVCKNDLDLNITLIPHANSAQDLFVGDWEVDRRFLSHIDNESDGDVFYNTTSYLWQTKYSHEYYLQGAKYVSVNCTHDSLSYYDANTTTELTIVNLAPLIFVGNITNPMYTINPLLTNIIDFAGGTWTFYRTVVDNNLSYLIFTLRNATNIVYSDSRNNVTGSSVNFTGTTFADFGGNPFNVSIWANDTFGASTFVSYIFNVTDTQSPACEYFVNDSGATNSTYTFDVTCYDENFFSLNVTCDNGFSSFVEGLNVVQYAFNSSFSLTANTTCQATYCDGHTLEALSSSFIVEYTAPEEVKTISNGYKNKFYDVINESVITKNILKDRISFTVAKQKDVKLSKDEVRSFYYEASPNSYYFPSTKYKGWIVDGDAKTWFDGNIENDKDAKVTVKRISPTLWKIDVVSVQEVLEFESIGELNCVTDYFNITSINMPIEYREDTEFVVGECPRNLNTVMMSFVMVIIILFMLTIGLLYPIFGVLGSLLMISMSWYFIGCAKVFGWGMALIALVLIIFYALKE